MPRPTVSHPGYVYRPWSEDRRKKAKAAAVAGSGARPGHRILYGIQVPEEYWPLLNRPAAKYRNGKKKHTLVQTRKMIRDASRKLARLIESIEGK